MALTSLVLSAAVSVPLAQNIAQVHTQRLCRNKTLMVNVRNNVTQIDKGPTKTVGVFAFSMLHVHPWVSVCKYDRELESCAKLTKASEPERLNFCFILLACSINIAMNWFNNMNMST